jgi:hypothetical protein
VAGDELRSFTSQRVNSGLNLLCGLNAAGYPTPDAARDLLRRTIKTAALNIDPASEQEASKMLWGEPITLADLT